MKTKNGVKVAIFIFSILAIIYFSIHIWRGMGFGLTAFQTKFYSRYQLHLWIHNPPNHFITFDQINVNDEFEFRKFRLPNSDYGRNYYRYRYDVTVSDNSNLTLLIRHSGYHTPSPDVKVTDLPDGVNDLREFTATTENRWVHVGDIEYVYVQDSSTGKYKLYGVMMVINDIQFEWYMDDWCYSNDPNSFIERLLHADTAEDARDEFAASIRGKHPSQAHRQVLRWGIPAFVVIGLGAFGIIYRRRRKLTSK